MTRARPANNGDEGHRSKRMKTGDEKATLLLKPDHNNRVTPPARDNGKGPLELVVEKELDQAYHSPYTAKTASQPMTSLSQSSGKRSVSEKKSTSTLASKSPSQGVDAAVQVTKRATNIEIDFSTAPSDPLELALWVARRISQFGVDHPEPEDNADEENESKRTSLSHPHGRSTRRSSNRALSAKLVSQRNSRRDKDNDLRCRVNARAKTLWGDHPSAEKASWMEVEFRKRRSKREKKRQSDGTFPGFNLDTNLAITLFPDQSTVLSRNIHAAGTLLLNTLQGVRNGTISPNRESAAALKFGLEDSSENLKPFVEALRVLGGSSQVINAIEIAMQEYDEDAEPTKPAEPAKSTEPTEHAQKNAETDKVSAYTGGGSPSGASESPSLVQASGIRGGIARSYVLDTNFQSDDVVKALNTATDILTDIAAGTSDTYVTPYANPPIILAQNGLAMANGNSKHETRNGSKQNGAEISLDRSQVDNLLELAAGGSESDEDEDDILPDAQGAIVQKENEVKNAQQDDDVLATLQCIVNELMVGANGGSNLFSTENGQALSNGTSQTDMFGTDTAKEQAVALKRSFDRAGVSINTIIPAAQSLATSQLYAHLSSRANRFPTSGGGINPNNASAYGNTADMTQRMLSRPGNAVQNLQFASPHSRMNSRPPVRGRNAEELKKVQEYGFPPLPGSRPGKKRKL